MMGLRRILVGIDFRPPSLRAAQWAAELSDSTVRVDLVCVLPAGGRGFRRRAMEGLEGFASTLARTTVRLHVRVGDPVTELCDLLRALDADLLVLGRHHSGGSGGRPRERQLRHVSVPVLVVGGQGAARPRRVLAAVDDSAVRTGVLTAALSTVRRFGGELAVAQQESVDLIVIGRNGRHAAGPTELGTTTRLLARVPPVTTPGRSARASVATGPRVMGAAPRAAR